jgi:hypothetical protein
MTEPHQARPDVKAPVRNHWYTGELLDAYHLRKETHYGNHKRWLLNRLVLGSGVVLGLDVQPDDKHADPHTVTVTPGLAIDWHGREVIVPEATSCTIPDYVIAEAAAQQGNGKQQAQQAPKKSGQHGGKAGGEGPPKRVWVQVLIGYREEEGDPVAVDYGGDCGTATCVPGSVYERYRIHFAPTPAEGVRCQCHVPNLPSASPSELHRILADWVTRHRPKRHLVPPRDPDLVLANVPLDWADGGWRVCGSDIDITVREVVYSNDLLFQLILGLAESPAQQRGGK